MHVFIDIIFDGKEIVHPALKFATHREYVLVDAP